MVDGINGVRGWLISGDETTKVGNAVVLRIYTKEDAKLFFELEQKKPSFALMGNKWPFKVDEPGIYIRKKNTPHWFSANMINLFIDYYNNLNMIITDVQSCCTFRIFDKYGQELTPIKRNIEIRCAYIYIRDLEALRSFTDLCNRNNITVNVNWSGAGLYYKMDNNTYIRYEDSVYTNAHQILDKLEAEK